MRTEFNRAIEGHAGALLIIRHSRWRSGVVCGSNQPRRWATSMVVGRAGRPCTSHRGDRRWPHTQHRAYARRVTVPCLATPGEDLSSPLGTHARSAFGGSFERHSDPTHDAFFKFGNRVLQFEISATCLRHPVVSPLSERDSQAPRAGPRLVVVERSIPCASCTPPLAVLEVLVPWYRAKVCI